MIWKAFLCGTDQEKKEYLRKGLCFIPKKGSGEWQGLK